MFPKNSKTLNHIGHVILNINNIQIVYKWFYEDSLLDTSPFSITFSVISFFYSLDTPSERVSRSHKSRVQVRPHT